MTCRRCFTPWPERPRAAPERPRRGLAAPWAASLRFLHAVIRCRSSPVVLQVGQISGDDHETHSYAIDSIDFYGVRVRGCPVRLPSWVLLRSAGRGSRAGAGRGGSTLSAPGRPGTCDRRRSHLYVGPPGILTQRHEQALASGGGRPRRWGQFSMIDHAVCPANDRHQTR
jgi:hypothetical protein